MCKSTSILDEFLTSYFPNQGILNRKKKVPKLVLGTTSGPFILMSGFLFLAGGGGEKGSGCRIGWRNYTYQPQPSPKKNHGFRRQSRSQLLNFSNFRVLEYRIEVSTLQLFSSKDLLKMHQKASYTSVAEKKMPIFTPPKTSTFR